MKHFRWRRLVGALLILLAAAYVGAQIWGNWGELRAHEWRVAPVLLLASVLLQVGVLAWGVWVWSRVIAGFVGYAPSLIPLLAVWFLSNLAKYIPGKVFQFIAVAQLAGRTGIAGSILVASLIAHTLITIGTGLLVVAWTLGTAVLPGATAAAFVLAAGAIATAHPALLRRALALVAMIPGAARLGVPGWYASWSEGLLILGASVVSWLLSGVAFYLLVASLTPIAPADLLQLTGINALSVVAGILSLLPAGAGVREVTMTELMRTLLPDGVAAALAVIARLWSIAAEIVGGLIALALLRATAAPGAAGPPDR